LIIDPVIELTTIPPNRRSSLTLELMSIGV
jgi:hypothetical protein